jgi:CubicO group peptidase (beta-lactamase class C family)
VERVTGRPLGEHLHRVLFEPLGLANTTLGDPLSNSGGSFPDRLAEIRVPEDMAGGDDWNWNSGYWRALGAPWGGMISTAGDLGRLCAMLLQGGTLDGQRVLSPASISLATSDQLMHFPDLPESERRTRSWGLGWRRQWPTHPASFGDLVGVRAYGHWGASGCLFWIDPDRRAAAVLLSTQPLERDRSPLIRLSNVVAAALS